MAKLDKLSWPTSSVFAMLVHVGNKRSAGLVALVKVPVKSYKLFPGLVVTMPIIKNSGYRGLTVGHKSL